MSQDRPDVANRTEGTVYLLLSRIAVLVSAGLALTAWFSRIAFPFQSQVGSSALDFGSTLAIVLIAACVLFGGQIESSMSLRLMTRAIGGLLFGFAAVLFVVTMVSGANGPATSADAAWRSESLALTWL